MDKKSRVYYLDCRLKKTIIKILEAGNGMTLKLASSLFGPVLSIV